MTTIQTSTTTMADRAVTTRCPECGRKMQNIQPFDKVTTRQRTCPGMFCRSRWQVTVSPVKCVDGTATDLVQYILVGYVPVVRP